ncbi:MAG: helix-turn-helix domain-containing protein, partial [Planctomycetes bacterium]|nr:helix-turn-helix domain-containing protein [Planctomycetota bacterium]
MNSYREHHMLPEDYAERIRRMRKRLGLTQKQMAARLGMSHITVCRWEKGLIEPSAPSWQQLRRLDENEELGSAKEEPTPRDGERQEPPIDFTAHPEAVRAVVEGERLSFGHLENPAFATEVSNIDPLPHQRIAVYDHMLNQSRLRFLLADDAGAGKTIMSGLYIREMLTRRLIRRILIVPPAGLIGNWQRELETLFNLHFTIVTGVDTKHENPFVGSSGDRVIISVDTLAGERVFGRFKEEKVEPYDLVIFDEAHKLSVDRGADMRVRKTDRYKLAESLAGVRTVDAAWQLPWKPQHLLLLTATPHQGKDYPYYGLWRLLDPDVLSTPDAFALYSPDDRQRHFIRRTKEEMVRITGEPLYPKRVSDTLGYELSQGPVSEQSLYDQTTDYMRVVYNKARLLNRSAARLAMSVLQRRLASSTFALLRSLERRVEKLDELIHKVEVGELTMEQLLALQRDLEKQDDPLDAKTADEERTPGDDPDLDDREENEAVETELLAGVIATSLADLIDERDQVISLLDLARQVHEKGEESKFEKLREVIADPRFHDEKFLVFTEHRDTLLYLVQRLRGMGYSGQIARIHGGMNYKQRQAEVD